MDINYSNGYVLFIPMSTINYVCNHMSIELSSTHAFSYCVF